MSWNYDTKEAPKIEVAYVEYMDTDGKAKRKRVVNTTRILTASKCGKVFISYHYTDEKDKDRWSGYATNERPVAWMPLPEPPKEIEE